MQIKQEASQSSGHHHHVATSEPQYISSSGVGERADDQILDSQIIHSEVRVAPDSIKEGWLNCKISNIDGKVSFYQYLLL